jgi:hypothetical protein
VVVEDGQVRTGVNVRLDGKLRTSTSNIIFNQDLLPPMEDTVDEAGGRFIQNAYIKAEVMSIIYVFPFTNSNFVNVTHKSVHAL